MNFYKFLSFLITICFTISCKQIEINETIQNTDASISTSTMDTSFDYFPTSTTNNIYEHKGYALSYVEEHEQAEWVAYYLEESDFTSVKYERPFFNQDPLVKTQSADWRNFKKTKYNKGHLCPAGDRKKSYEMDLSHLISGSYILVGRINNKYYSDHKHKNYPYFPEPNTQVQSKYSIITIMTIMVGIMTSIQKIYIMIININLSIARMGQFKCFNN